MATSIANHPDSRGLVDIIVRIKGDTTADNIAGDRAIIDLDTSTRLI